MVLMLVTALLAVGCSAAATDEVVTVTRQTTAVDPTIRLTAPAADSGTPGLRTTGSERPVPPTPRTRSTPRSTAPARPNGTFTFSFAGDVHFMERTLTRLQADPRTAFGAAAAGLARADLTMVNLETAITDNGEKQAKSFTFKAPASALTALSAAGVDLATEANNHGADYGATGLTDTLAAIKASKFPVIGIGADAAQAYRPFTTTVNGVKIAVLAASQVHDETLQNWTADTDSAGIAAADSPEFLAAVKAAKAAGSLVIVYLHWGTEYTTCPDPDQERLADQLAAAGVTAIIGTHAHVLQGAGWRQDGVYVAYGLSNFLWWRSFGNEQDDAGVLTLTFARGRVTGSSFAPAHLDDTGVPVPATGATKDRIMAEWERDRQCANLSAAPTG